MFDPAQYKKLSNEDVWMELTKLNLFVAGQPKIVVLHEQGDDFAGPDFVLVNSLFSKC